MPAFQDDELLAKSEILQHQVLARTKKAKGGSEPDPEKVEHSGKVIADRILIRAFMSLIPQSDGIVASDNVQYQIGLFHAQESGEIVEVIQINLDISNPRIKTLRDRSDPRQIAPRLAARGLSRRSNDFKTPARTRQQLEHHASQFA
jgi:hypothetical protein